MKIIGCDFHPGYQQIAMLDLASGEIVQKALSHERKEEVRAFYAGLQLRAETEDRPARCGFADEASGGGSLSADLGAHGGREFAPLLGIIRQRTFCLLDMRT